MRYTSKMRSADWAYPPLDARRSGWLDVSVAPPHRLYWEEYGNPEGEPVMFLHGGPGGGTTPELARFFDPARYRIVLFDQRGCGKSEPSAAADDPVPALRDNTTPHLIGDILQLRDALGITGKMHIFGGSWGSTLALAYAIAHPHTVQTLILRGIFLTRRCDLNYFYQGNAAHYASNPLDTRLPGAYLFYPEAWARFVTVIPEAERGDMVKAYHAIFRQSPSTPETLARQTDAAIAWSVWEGVTSFLAQDMDDPGKFAEPEFARAFARIENHYFMNGCFLGGSGEENRNQNFLLEQVHHLKGIPVHIVHGRYDQVCPMFQAEALVAALRQAGVTPLNYRLVPAAHSAMEREIQRELTEIMNRLPSMKAE